ncbi:MAG: hypothetical protein R2713_23475 [Ilumatobacteraceae bacterium]
MLERAGTRGYDRLVQADLVDFLAGHTSSSDVAVRRHSFTWGSRPQVRRRSGGDDPVTTGRVRLHARTRRHGCDRRRRLPARSFGRSVHDESYVLDELAAAGFAECRATHVEILRHERQHLVHGLVVTART